MSSRNIQISDVLRRWHSSHKNWGQPACCSTEKTKGVFVVTYCYIYTVTYMYLNDVYVYVRICIIIKNVQALSFGRKWFYPL